VVFRKFSWYMKKPKARKKALGRKSGRAVERGGEPVIFTGGPEDLDYGARNRQSMKKPYNFYRARTFSLRPLNLAFEKLSNPAPPKRNILKKSILTTMQRTLTVPTKETRITNCAATKARLSKAPKESTKNSLIQTVEEH
jgi:hypothetical protein